MTTSMTEEPISTSTISVFTRHSAECPQREDREWRRCKCRKSLYIRENGKTTFLSAKTRSWEQAERVAQAEREKRDPVKVELARIAEVERVKAVAEKKAAEKKAARLIPLSDALKQWLSGMKNPGKSSVDAYRSTTRQILRWAATAKVIYVSDLTPALLDKWVGSWKPDAEEVEDRLKLNSQATRLTRIKAFATWATGMHYIDRDPTLTLKAITPEESATQPLTPEQFAKLDPATRRFDAAQEQDRTRIGQWLRAIFLVQRWTGLRVGDVLILPRTALVGNRLTAIIRKKRNKYPNKCTIERILPDAVAEALHTLPLKKEIHPAYFFWSRKSTEVTNVNKWLRKIDALNDLLSFEDEDGNPLRFRSHMLRDTFAVEHLLADMPIEQVSWLLTHESVKMTERYYAKWTKKRKEKLERQSIEAMRRQGMKVTIS
ncbi:MAG: tyrosine-type recombinase/integrase [Acidobacteriota bacterium]|nr:tyrosine-type recombinase/integrase [Acidobacteriota bacterium]